MFGVSFTSDSINNFLTQPASGTDGLDRSQGTAPNGAPYVAGWIQFQGLQVGSILNQATGVQVAAPLLTPDAIAAK